MGSSAPKGDGGRRPRVVVVGGSLGGLNAALWLRDAGCDVEVFEKSPAEMQSRGAGIVVQPDAVRYLEEHGIVRTDAISTMTTVRRYLDRDGRVVAQGRMVQRFTAWNTLYRSHKGAFPADRYHLATALVDFAQDGRQVVARFGDGREEACDLLVGADGASSTVRRQLLPDVHAEYAGYVAWRGVVEEGDAAASLVAQFADAFTFFQYPNSHILCYLIPGADGEVEVGTRRLNWVWYVNVPAGDALRDVMTDNTGRLRELSVPPGRVQDRHVRDLRALADRVLAPPFRELVAATAEPFIQPIIDLAVPQMAFERVCLVGDAAFVPRPHTAASTAKAAADAFALAAAVQRTGGDVPAALRRWEPGQLALGRRLEAHGRALGDRSQFGAPMAYR